jgi:Type II secretion system (T2SS), protein E, N-terminal domain
MSSNPPSEGTFFVDQPTGAQPAPAPAPQAPPPAPAADPVAPPAAAPAAEASDIARDGMKDVPLGTLIFRAGLLAEEQLEDALQDGMRTGKRLGEVLLERGWLHERDLGRLLAGQKGLPFVELSGVTPDPTAVPLIPEEKARLQSALAIAFEKGVPVVAVADPTNDLVMENLRRLLGCEPRLVVAAHGDLQRKIAEAYAPIDVASEVPPAAPAVEPPAAETAAAQQVPAPASPPAEPTAAPVQAPTVEPMPVAQPPVESAQAPAEPPTVVAQPLVQPLVQPAAEQPQPAPPSAPEPASVEPGPPVVETPPPVVQPLSPAPPVAPEVAAAPPVEAAATAPEPAPEPAPVEVAPDVQAAAAEQSPEPQAPALEQAPPAEAAEPALSAAEPVEPVAETSRNGSVGEQVATHYVVVRLTEGEQLEIGSLGSFEEAQGFAQEVVRQIAAAEGDSTWPFFAGRFLRPSGIVSVDVVEGASERWMGSQVRARTFGA